MPVVVVITNPGSLVDKAAGVGGLGDVAEHLGLGDTVAAGVDSLVADQVRQALADQGAAATVYTTSDAPGSSGGRFPYLLVGALAVGLCLALYRRS